MGKAMDEGDYAREYERLRAELADFVVDALAQRVAAGEQPELSKALVEAIDRRVNAAIDARLANLEWPDPDAFADQVIAAAGGRSGALARGEGASVRRSVDSGARRQPVRSGRMSRIQLWLLAIVAVVIIAAATVWFLNRSSAPVKTETVNNVNFTVEEPLNSSTNTLPPNGQVPVQNGQQPNR